jgi:hypothetical protein
MVRTDINLLVKIFTGSRAAISEESHDLLCLRLVVQNK